MGALRRICCVCLLRSNGPPCKEGEASETWQSIKEVITMERALVAATSHAEESAPRLPQRWFAGKERRPGNQPGSGSTSRGEKPKRLGFWLRLLFIMFLLNLFFYGP